MPNPTRQDIINAHDSLEELKHAALKSTERCGDTDHFLMCKDEILKVLPPRPQPTMDEVEWDDDKHLLAEAEHSGWGKVVMLNDDEGICIEVLRKYHGKNKRDYARADELTPTGRKFALTEANNE